MNIRAMDSLRARLSGESVAVQGPPEPPGGHNGPVRPMMVIRYSVEMRSSGEQECKEVADKMVHPSLPMDGMV
uniref:Uncharacterized protein n=1 Tax=Timema douglasi TaxID=61478 RepID=A0A7R8VW22_TIMDO|nr:unnamed protein product [Timema douglasi]